MKTTTKKNILTVIAIAAMLVAASAFGDTTKADWPFCSNQEDTSRARVQALDQEPGFHGVGAGARGVGLRR